MADFDRSAEFRRNLRQLREVSGGALETVPLGGDSLNPQTNAGLLRAKHEADAAAMTLKRYIEQAKIEEKKLNIQIPQARSAEQRLALRMSQSSRASLGQQLRAEGFGTRGSGSIRSMLPTRISKGMLSLRGGLKGVGGGPLLTTAAIMTAIGGGLNAIADAREEYDAIKKAGGTDEQARRALVKGAIESVASSAIGISGAASISEGLGRAFGMSKKDAEHRFNRFYAKALNESAFARRELIAANEALNADNEVIEKWNKLDTSSPKTFRLRTKAEAQAYQSERRVANDMELNRQLFKNSNDQQAKAAGRVASGN
jgi:hypothetical protein